MKRYSNATFTKRVDHHGGSHRPPRAGEEPQVCEECGALYANRRWMRADIVPPRAGRSHKDAARTVCPACRQARTGLPGGFVSLEGTFFNAHRTEVERLLLSEAERAGRDNPLARIMGWSHADRDRLTVTTTTEHLAQRLGHAVQKAFSGEVRYDFSHENKVARVYWRRD